MAERFQTASIVFPTERDVIGLCVILQDSSVSPQLIVSLAEKLRDAGENKGTARWLLGAAYYRNGQYQKAVLELDEAIRFDFFRTDSRRPLVFMRLFSALAHHRLGVGATDIAQIATSCAFSSCSNPLARLLPVAACSSQARVLFDLAKEDVDATKLPDWELRLRWRRLQAEAQSALSTR